MSLEFSPDPRCLEQACACLGDFLGARGLSAERFPLCLLLREAASNAVRHGCKGQGTLKLGLDLRENKAVLTLEHDGPGWDWRSKEPTLAEPGETTGRGLFIMKSYSDSITYNDRGNRVCITRSLPAR